MEYPRRALTLQRGLAALFILLAAAAALVERGSPLAGKIRMGRPFLAWVSTREEGRPAPRLHLAVYDPLRRSLAVIHLPDDTRLEGKRTLAKAFVEALRASDDLGAAARAAEDLAGAKLASLSPEPADWSGATRLALEGDEPAEDGEPPLSAALGLKTRLRRPAFWWGLLRAAGRGLRAGDRTAADPLLLAFELRLVPLERLQPAWLPADELAPAFLARLLSGEPAPAAEGAITAEVLNATDSPGLASSAAKMLRLGGVDVVSTGAAARRRERTVVYDRTGDFARAAAVAAKLECRGARAVTRLDASRAVDATVELGADCAASGTPGRQSVP